MRQYRIYTLIIAGVFALATSCKDDSLELIPEWESAVHGLAEVTSDNTDFKYNEPTAPVDIDLQWISIDSKLTVTRIEVFAIFNENYIDKDGNPAVAAHGGAQGRSFRIYEGSAVPANRTPLSFSVSQNDLYTLYSAATFDYDGNPATPPTPVFNNPGKPARDADHRFMWDDKLSVKWVFTTDDGRVFQKWGVSVCTEFPGANCSVDFTVVCATEIENPQGTWTFNMVDTYGDGWQGGYISVLVDGVEAKQINIPDSYNPPSNPDIAALTDTFTFPATGSTLKFVWSPDTYNSECEFKIISPSGNTVANVSGPPAGPIKLDLCLE